MSEDKTQLPFSEEQYFNRKYKCTRDGEVFTCLGVMLGDDDWYYVMWQGSGRQLRLLSCVGDLVKSHRYEPIDP